jgi:hypothetical protein
MTAALLDITNSYMRRARLTPTLIVVLPLGLTVLAWSPDGLKSWTISAGAKIDQ